MKIWHLLAVASGAIIATAMALASISYNATLGTVEPAFGRLPFLTNSLLFASLALAFDLGMIASVFGFLHWRDTSRTKAFVCAILFVIASGYSIHSVRGYIATNLSQSQAPAVRSADIYTSLRLELRSDQAHLERLRLSLLDTRRRSERRTLRTEIAQLSSKIDALRSRLAQTDTGHRVSPLDGLEWFLAVTLWFFHATCWSAWFGHTTRARLTTSELTPPEFVNADTVAGWLNEFDLSEPEHCATLYRHYADWCARNTLEPLAQYGFYGRLVELGARKFRDGRNGPTKYVMPPG